MTPQVLEGSWEEITRHADALKGRQVRLIVLTEAPAPNKAVSAGEPAWPAGFLEHTFGSLADEPLERLPQGEMDKREP